MTGKHKGFHKIAFLAAAVAALAFSSLTHAGNSIEAERHKVASLVYQWAAAWENNVYSIGPYKSYYSRDFFSNYKARSGMNYSEWMADKQAKARKAGCIKVTIDDLSVDIDVDVAIATFKQTYMSDSYCDKGTKMLYFMQQGGEWKIVGEEQSGISKCSARCSAPGRERQEITVLIHQWAAAWENNVYSIESYRSFYDRYFWSNYKAKSGMDYNKWMDDKAAKGRKAKCIWIGVSDIKIDLEEEFATARFMQRYVSDSYCDYGTKTLYLIKRSSGWKIIGEEQPSANKCSDRCSY